MDRISPSVANSSYIYYVKTGLGRCGVAACITEVLGCD